MERRRRNLARAAKGLAAILIVALVLPGQFDGRASPVSPAAAHANPLAGRHSAEHDRATVHNGALPGRSCPMVVSGTPYVNPLADARVRSERIDQGVDYAGSGALEAMGSARIVYVGTSDTGWPGAFVEYQLLTGPDAGCYVFYAEGVTPEPGLHVGSAVSRGQPIATIIPNYSSGFEVGWGAGNGTKTLAALTGVWTSGDDQANVASGPGRNFSALIYSLGGPPGIVEG